MPQFLDRWLAWFRAQRADTRAVIVAFTLLVAVVASPVLRWLTTVALIAVVVALIVRAAQRSPVRYLVIVAGGLLAATIAFGAVASAVYGPSGGGTQEEAQRPKPSGAEETTVVTQDEEAPMSTEGPAAAGIPTAEELISGLEQKGYTCTDLGEVGDGRELRRCEAGDARPGGTGVMVLIWSTQGGSLDSVQANSYGYGEDPGGVFAYLAAMPATRAEEADEARAWVERNFATAAENPVQRSAGGMDFGLEGGGQTRILSIDVSGT